jgi:hypothetical protein
MPLLQTCTSVAGGLLQKHLSSPGSHAICKDGMSLAMYMLFNITHEADYGLLIALNTSVSISFCPWRGRLFNLKAVFM